MAARCKAHPLVFCPAFMKALGKKAFDCVLTFPGQAAGGFQEFLLYGALLLAVSADLTDGEGDSFFSEVHLALSSLS